MTSIPYSLRHLLGEDPAKVTAEGLSHLVGWLETDQVDWKRQLNKDPRTNQDLARDVAAFANTSGGLFIVGLDEDPATSRANEFVGVDPSEIAALVDRAHSIIRGTVHPPVSYSVEAVQGPGGVTVVLIAVDPSESAPHAAAEGDALRYPIRGGSGKRYLSEAEVADWYGRRLRRIAGQDARTDELRSQAVPRRFLTNSVAWLVVTLAPARPGSGRLLRGDLDAYRELLRPHRLRRYPNYPADQWNVRIGHRAITAFNRENDPDQYAVLAVDGSGSVALRWVGRSDSVHQDRTYLTAHTHWALSTLVTHAVHRGASGTASTSAQVVAATETTVNVTDLDHASWNIQPPPPEQAGASPVSLRTIDIDAIAGSDQELLAATHLIGVDVASYYGHADLPGITPEGELRS